MLDYKHVEQIKEMVMKELEASGLLNRFNQVPASISARHLHISRADLDILFGKDYKLTVSRWISQPGQFASNEKVTLVTENGSINNVRILGPLRQETQVELAKSDIRRLGLQPHVRSSGNIKGTPGILLRGPKGQVELSQGVIIADRHIHMKPNDASNYGVKDGQEVAVKVSGPRGGVLEHVKIRVSENYVLDFHIDTDDASAFLIETGDLLELIVQ